MGYETGGLGGSHSEWDSEGAYLVHQGSRDGEGAAAYYDAQYDYPPLHVQQRSGVPPGGARGPYYGRAVPDSRSIVLRYTHTRTRARARAHAHTHTYQSIVLRYTRTHTHTHVA